MSVVRIGEQRFAAGLEWSRTLVGGRVARRVSRQRGRPWTVDVIGQTGFLDDAEAPGGTKPLAGALMALMSSRPGGAENWVAFVEEDGRKGTGRRVATVRCYGALLLPDGDQVFASAKDAVEALGGARGDNVLVFATEELAGALKELGGIEVTAVIDGEGIARAGESVSTLATVPSGRLSRKRVLQLSALFAVAAVCVAVWTNPDFFAGLWAAEKKKEERPKVRVVVETGRFLAFCREELERRGVWLAGFEGLSVRCHSSFQADKGIGAPGKLGKRAVLEVRWQLRDPLPPRVYGRLGEQLLGQWYWAAVNEEGQAVAISPLPQVLALAGKRERIPTPQFRSRMDGMFALRGFGIEYAWRKKAEVVLTTERPLAVAVAMLAEIEGLEVLSASYREGAWRFEGRQTRPRSMFKDEFERVAKPLAWRTGELEKAA